MRENRNILGAVKPKQRAERHYTSLQSWLIILGGLYQVIYNKILIRAALN